MKALRAAPDIDPEVQFKERIAHKYFLRFHMTLILTGVIVAGVISSKLMLELHIHSMRLRYPIATIVSYLVFLLFVRMWIWYVARNRVKSSSRGMHLDDGDFQFGTGFGTGSSSGGGGGGGDGLPTPKFGGGSSGGGGASDVWDEPMAPAMVSQSASSGGGGSSGSHHFGGGGGKGFDLDFGDDGFVIVLIGLLVVGIVCAGGYLIYVAPNLLPECACQAVLAGTLTKVTKRVDHQNWMITALRASAIPFAIVVILAGLLGWGAHKHCPTAVKLHEALFCELQPQAPAAQ